MSAVPALNRKALVSSPLILAQHGLMGMCWYPESPSCPPQGFYAVYDTLFEKLVQQEVRAAEKRGKGSAHEDVSGAPRFGAQLAVSNAAGALLQLLALNVCCIPRQLRGRQGVRDHINLMHDCSPAC